MSVPSGDEAARYARQIALPEFGVAGQERLRGARVLLIGAGGLGSPAALYLASAGVGTLGVVDPDRVELSNLHRQILHGTADTGRPKVESARDRIAEANPHVRVESFAERFCAANARDFVRGWDVVVDGCDNFPTRYASNDACVAEGVPNVYGSVWRFEGQVAVFLPSGPCYRCINPQPPAAGSVPSCAEAGVLGVLPGLVGTLQALEAIKLLTGLGESLAGRLLHIDGLAMKFREFKLRRDPACARCSEGRAQSPIEEVVLPCPAPAAGEDEISVTELAAWRERAEDHVLLDVREDWELAVARLEECVHIPLGQLPVRAAALPADKPIFVMCHAGVRSASAVRFLRGAGFPQARNVRGGIAAWSAQVDPSVPAY